MMRRARLLVGCLCLAACQAAPPERPDWSEFAAWVDHMDPSQLQMARDEAIQRYTVEPSDANRLRAGYVLSRAEASLAQLEQSRDILAQISADSELAPLRDLLNTEIRLMRALRLAELRDLEQSVREKELRDRAEALEARNAALQSEINDLRTRLDALKAIEEDVAENQKQADEMRE